MTKSELEKNRNEDSLKLMVSKLNHRLEKIHLGGGERKIAKQHEKGKLTARERIDYLTDDDKPVFEIGAFAGYEMYEEHGGCPAGGVVAVVAYVRGRQQTPF